MSERDVAETGLVAARPGPRRWPVGKASDIAPGERRLVEVKGHAIGLFNVNGEFVATLNLCPHPPGNIVGGARGRSWPVRGTAGSSIS